MRALGLTACLAVAVLAVPAIASAQEEEPRPLPPLAPSPPDDLGRALARGELDEAGYALERARSVFQLARARREWGDVERAGRRDATMLLRDLALRVDELTGADRTAARRLLARPDGGGVPIGNGWTSSESANSPLCSLVPGVELCLHWVDGPGDPAAPDPVDDDPFNGIPDFVDLALATLESVWAREIGDLGYRAPLSDGDSSNDGGDGRLDVYLEDLGSAQVFGYCTSDDPDAGSDVYAVSAYCVLDEDFREFGTAHSPQEFLEVTAAHEFHHASQFAYDWLEDSWLLEGTAANIEETVFPEVDDNVNFLSYSPLTRPWSALDRGGLGDSEYGAWIFWRFLEEKVAGDPAILREIWERVDAHDPDPATPGDEPPDDYSLRALRRELGQRGHAFADVFARFGVVNRRGSYADGDTAGYPVPPLSRVFRIGGGAGWKPERRTRLQHLATRFFAFVPRATAPRRGDLRLRLTVPRHGGRASVLVVRRDGTTTSRVYRQEGTLGRRVEFGRARVKRVELALSNGSTRTRCWRDTVPPSYSCYGTPRDNRRLFRFRVRLAP